VTSEQGAVFSENAPEPVRSAPDVCLALLLQAGWRRTQGGCWLFAPAKYDEPVHMWSLDEAWAREFGR